ncbi:MAG TPA: hypothetical protein VH325_05000 [Bryobacteraceae bacterium]|nr:hypothetical protein [Bryobacteraceae bacterium]
MHFGRWWRMVFLVLAVSSAPATLKASFCMPRGWTLSDIADAPLLLVGRVVSLEMENGPHFTGDPKRSAPAQKMTAEVKVLRFTQKAGLAELPSAGTVYIRFVGRDGPDFSFCPVALPELEPGQVLLLPLRANANASSEPLRLIGDDGYGMITRVAEQMAEPATPTGDMRAFIVRELINSFRRGDPISLYTASGLVAQQGDYLEPDLSIELERSLSADRGRWAQVLGNMLLLYPDGPKGIADVSSGATASGRFKGSGLVKLALRHLGGDNDAQAMVGRAILDDIPGFADEPYHELFSYNPNPALHAAEEYLLHHSDRAYLIENVRTGLREDRPGFLSMAWRLIYNGQNLLIANASEKATKVLRRPSANADDLMAAINLLLQYATGEQRREYAAIATGFKSTDADYAAFLELELRQSQQAAVK